MTERRPLGDAPVVGTGAGAEDDAAILGIIETRARVGARRKWWTVRLGQIALGVAAIIGWAYASGRWIDPLFVSTPRAVFDELVALVRSGQLARHLGITLAEVLAGYAAGALAGLVAAFAIFQLPTLGLLLEPYVVALYAVPRIALAPLIIMWFGIGFLPKIVLGGTLVFFLVFMNALAGFRTVSPGLIGVVRVMGASSHQVLTKVVLWTAMPYLLATLRTSLPSAVIGVIIAEFISANRGLGYLISAMSSQFNTAGVFAGILSLMVVVATLNTLASTLERRLLRWQPGRTLGGEAS